MKVTIGRAAPRAVQLVALDDPAGDRTGHQRAGDHGERRRADRDDLRAWPGPAASSSFAQAMAVPGPPTKDSEPASTP